jgi:hypothetical protein
VITTLPGILQIEYGENEPRAHKPESDTNVTPCNQTVRAEGETNEHEEIKSKHMIAWLGEDFIHSTQLMLQFQQGR